MKTIKQTTFLILSLFLFSCGSDDNNVPVEPPANAELLIGNWEHTSGEAFGDECSYILFSDNNVQFLFQDEQGFKDRDETGAINALTEEGFNLPGGPGVIEYTYNISEGNTLTVTNAISNRTSTFTRNNNAPSYEDWIVTLEVQVSSETPWANATDITKQGDFILGYDESASVVFPFDSNTLENGSGTIFGSRAFALAYDTDGDLLLHSNGNDETIYSSELDGLLISQETIGFPLDYIAYRNESIWMASSSEKLIINFGNPEITISKRPFGIELRGGFLYISTFDLIHKCEIIGDVTHQGEIRAVETYEINQVSGIRGIVSDGNDLWVNYQESGEEDKLVKTSLTF